MARKLVQAVSILLGTLVGLELLLQLVAWVGVDRRGAPLAQGASGRDFVVLCVGDSHTFGAGVTTGESYPAQLEGLLRERRAGVRFRLLNYGVPGVNTAYVANRLEGWILEAKPDLVIVWVGINNWWNASETDSWGRSGVGTTLRRWLLHSRLARIAAVAWQTREGVAGVRSRGPEMWYLGADQGEKGKAPGHRVGGSEIARGTAFDLRRMISTARALDVSIVMVDYPYPNTSESLGGILREVTGRLGVPLVSTLPARHRARTDGFEREELIFQGAGVHPTGVLYGYIAEAILPHVLEAVDRRRAPGPGSAPATAER